jgi:vacuolar-type H+-ATPase subunit E/Vma4
MALSELLAALRRNAEAEAAEFEARAAADIDRLRADAQAEEATLRDSSLRDLEEQERRSTAMALGDAWLESQKLVLTARARLLERVFAAATQRAAGWRWREGERERLAARVAAARRLAGGREVTVEERDAGFILATRDGRLIIDDTVPSRLERRRDRLAQEIVRRVDAP